MMQTYLGDYVRKECYKKVLKHDDTGRQRNIVKKIIESYPEGITDMEISVMTGISRSSVTGRRNELPNIVVVGVAKIVDSWGDRLNILWGMQDAEEIC